MFIDTTEFMVNTLRSAIFAGIYIGTAGFGFLAAGLQGQYVPLKDTIRGFREILDGKHDDLPESAFLFVGSIDEAVEKAKKA